MAPVPVFILLALLGMSVFVRVPVVFHQECSPRAILVLIPIVIVLVISIVDPDLNAGFLWCRCGYKQRWRCKCRSQEKRNDVTMCMMHDVVLQNQNVRSRNRGSIHCALETRCVDVPFSTQARNRYRRQQHRSVGGWRWRAALQERYNRVAPILDPGANLCARRQILFRE